MRVLVLLATTLWLPPQPGWIPAWSGREPLCFCVDRTLEPHRNEVLRAYATWMALAGLPWSEERDCNAPRTVAYRLTEAEFSGGFAFWPPPLFPEPLAGDIYLSKKVLQEPEYIYPLLLHETGHALGLPESFDERDVMWPYTSPQRVTPTAREVRHIRCLYAGECY